MELKEHLTNLVKSLTNLSPSRNIIPQFILMLPRDYATIERSFPEFSSSNIREVLEILGCEFGDEVRRVSGFSEQLYIQIHKIFDWLDNEDVRANLSRIVKTSMPNPYAEWAELVLKKFLREPDGDKIIEFLKMLVECQSYIVDRKGYSRGAYKPDWQPFLDEAREKLGVSQAEFEEIVRKCIGKDNPHQYFTDPEYTHEYFDRFEQEQYPLHDEYHLDLVLSKKWEERRYSGWEPRYDHHYRLRHRETIRKILEEIGHEWKSRRQD